jgi:hypothetical protein
LKHKAKAQHLAAYARQVKDNELEKRSVEIREKARIRMGEMSLALPKAQGKRDDLHESTSLQDGNEVRPKVKALADAGITKAEAHRAEKIAKKSKESQEAHVAKAVSISVLYSALEQKRLTPPSACLGKSWRARCPSAWRPDLI